MKERFANVPNGTFLYFCHKINEFIAGGGGGGAYL